LCGGKTLEHTPFELSRTLISSPVVFLHCAGAVTLSCSVLVANNGLAAVKFMRSIRLWASQTFGHNRAIAMVAMATPEDIRINAEHVMQADQFVEVPGGTNNNNYANVKLIVQIAERAGVDAVWPGW
jgi:acetyl-CoA carboxylase/biotin carboxylase 1